MLYGMMFKNIYICNQTCIFKIYFKLKHSINTVQNEVSVSQGRKAKPDQASLHKCNKVVPSVCTGRPTHCPAHTNVAPRSPPGGRAPFKLKCFRSSNRNVTMINTISQLKFKLKGKKQQSNLPDLYSKRR